LQYNANIPQGSHFLFTFLITVAQINKIDLTLTSNLTLSFLTLSPNTNTIPNPNPVVNPKPDPNPNPNRSRKKMWKTTKKHHCESAAVHHIA